MSRTFQYASDELSIKIINPLDEETHTLIFTNPEYCNKWLHLIRDASSTWLLRFKSRESRTLSISSPNQTNYPKPQIFSNKSMLRIERKLNDLNSSQAVDLIVALDTQFSVSTAVPVDVDGEIDLVYSINIIQQFGNCTVLKRFSDIFNLHHFIESLNIYDKNELPLLPPIHFPFSKMPNQTLIQHQSRSLEVYFNELALLQPSIMQNNFIKKFFETEEDGLYNDSDTEDSCDSMDLVDDAFRSCSLSSSDFDNFHVIDCSDAGAFLQDFSELSTINVTSSGSF